MIDDYAEFEVYILGDDEEWICGSSGPRERALTEVVRYAHLYAEEGAIRVYEVSKKIVLELNKGNSE